MTGPAAQPSTKLAVDGSRGGFVLALVVLMLFAISIMGGAGYLIVSSEARMARYATQGEEALAIARGGLHRFMSEQLGVVADSVRYAIGAGETLVTARRMAAVDPVTDVYFVRSEAAIVDPFSPGTPARRVVGAYAHHRRRPVPLHAAIVLSVEDLLVGNNSNVSGVDIGGAVCPGGAAPSIGGAIAREDIHVNGTLVGTPPAQLWGGGYSQFMTQMALRWDVLSDPGFPVDFEDVYPDFSTLPADSFPVIRFNGNFHGTPSRSGRGVLIVRDEFDSVGTFTWEGIVLAGWVDDRIMGNIEGMLIGGFSGTEPNDEVETRNGDILYHACNVSRANESLSYLELIPNTLFEVR
ncbi:MAG: hypothetical protein WEA34_01985 [Gemmatimonadota bacterium]